MATLILALLGCEPADPGAEASPLIPLDPARLARRTSLDLRGRLPSLEELDAVEADPAALADLRAEWRTGDAFEERFASLLAERWLTRVDDFLIYASEYEALRDDETVEYAFERSVADEPLRLMAHVAGTDAPWSEIVTADYTMANGLLASIWPVEDPGGDGWGVSHYTDGRPAAGVLVSNGLWIRYYTTDSNKNRRRAAVVADLLLCADYLQRPVTFDSSASSVAGDPEEAIHTNPYCLGCHSSLDPMAATLFGFFTSTAYNVDDVGTYHAEREALGPLLLGVEQGYYGAPVSGLEALGAAIAADPRFHRCAAQTAAELYWRRPVTIDDFDRISTFQAAYEAGGERMGALIESVLADPVYQAGAYRAGATGDEHLARMMSPDVLDSALSDWAGLDWTWEGFDQLQNDDLGFRVLAGGVDGSLVTEPQSAPGLTWELVFRRAAQAAAASAITSGRVDPTLAPGDPAFDEALVDLHRQLLATRPDAARIDELTTLWTDAAALSDAETAWAAVIEFLLRDPLFVTL